MNMLPTVSFPSNFQMNVVGFFKKKVVEDAIFRTALSHMHKEWCLRNRTSFCSSLKWPSTFARRRELGDQRPPPKQTEQHVGGGEGGAFHQTKWNVCADGTYVIAWCWNPLIGLPSGHEDEDCNSYWTVEYEKNCPAFRHNQADSSHWRSSTDHCCDDRL